MSLQSDYLTTSYSYLHFFTLWFQHSSSIMYSSLVVAYYLSTDSTELLELDVCLIC